MEHDELVGNMTRVENTQFNPYLYCVEGEVS